MKERTKLIYGTNSALINTRDINYMFSIVNSNLSDEEKAIQLYSFCDETSLIRNADLYRAFELEQTIKLNRLISIYKDYEANKEGFKQVDLFGTCGIPNPTPDNPIYGIHNFKKRLGGEYTEFIGEFDLIANKLMYNAYNLYKKMKYRRKK